MNAIQSYLRHLIVCGVLFLVAKYKLPLEGANEMADALALAGIGTVTWLVVKYAPPSLAKLLGITSVVLLMALSLPSCAPGAPGAERSAGASSMPRRASVPKPVRCGNGRPSDAVDKHAWA